MKRNYHIRENGVVEIFDDFDLQKIADSGQCFRWKSLESGGYQIIHQGHFLIVEQIDEQMYRFHCTKNEFLEIWKEYLDLEENYRAIRQRINKDEDLFLYTASQKEAGIRMLRQDLWEILISFIISQNRSIPLIKKSIEILAEKAGERKIAPGGQVYYSFPTPKAICDMEQESLDSCKLGYRAKYVKAVSQSVLEGEIDLSALNNAGEEEARKELMGLYGVGRKVADCVILYGLYQKDAFPIDVWMKKILSREYPDGYSLDRYRPYNGVYQQYMFAYYRWLSANQNLGL